MAKVKAEEAATFEMLSRDNCSLRRQAIELLLGIAAMKEKLRELQPSASQTCKSVVRPARLAKAKARQRQQVKRYDHRL